MADNRIDIKGDVNGSAMAVGDHASAKVTIPAHSARIEASRLLAEFIAALEIHGGEERYVHMRELAESAKAEVAADRPDKGRLRALLEGIRALMPTMTSTVIGVADLADAVDKIWRAVGRI